jgi:hypothetical protein
MEFQPKPGELTEEDKKRGYRIGTWAGISNYECINCQFDITDQVKMQKHVANAKHHKHAWAFQPSAAE